MDGKIPGCGKVFYSIDTKTWCPKCYCLQMCHCVANDLEQHFRTHIYWSWAKTLLEVYEGRRIEPVYKERIDSLKRKLNEETKMSILP